MSSTSLDFSPSLHATVTCLNSTYFSVLSCHSFFAFATELLCCTKNEFVFQIGFIMFDSLLLTCHCR